MEKCFCHFNGYKVKDSDARKAIGFSEAVASVGDGVSSAAEAIRKHIESFGNNNGVLYFPDGVYNIGDGFSFPKNITLIFGGGCLKGENISVHGNIISGKYKIFDTSTKVTTTLQEKGYPEWFGAIPIDLNVDCAPAINLCIDSFRITELQALDYSIKSGIYLSETNKQLVGAMKGYERYPSVTCLRVHPGVAEAVRVGAKEQPSEVNSFPRNIVFKNISIWGDCCNNPVSACGIWWSLGAEIENVRAVNTTYGFYFAGSVAPKLYKCEAFYETGITGGVAGFHIDGDATSIGLAGGNASVYISYCSASAGGAPSNYCGIYVHGKSSDLYVDHFESSQCGTGAALLLGDNQNVDMFFTNCIFDQCHEFGFNLEGGNLNNAIVISDSYINCSAAGNGVGIFMNNICGYDFSNIQLIGCPVRALQGRLLRSNISNMRIIGGSTYPADFDAEFCDIDVAVVLTSNVDWAYQIGAIRSNLNLACTSNGGVANDGVLLLRESSSYAAIDITQIDPAACASGKAGCLNIKGTVVNADVCGDHRVSATDTILLRGVW